MFKRLGISLIVKSIKLLLITDQCAAGKGWNDKKKKCVTCSAGEYSEKGGIECRKCPKFHQSKRGAEECSCKFWNWIDTLVVKANLLECFSSLVCLGVSKRDKYSLDRQRFKRGPVCRKANRRNKICLPYKTLIAIKCKSSEEAIMTIRILVICKSHKTCWDEYNGWDDFAPIANRV